jgi:transposase
MPATQATTIAQRHKMMLLAEEGQSYAAVAEQLGVSFWTARRWIRQGKRGGLESLASCYGRPATGPLAGVDPLIRYVALRLKRQHPKWGAEYVVKKLGEKQSLPCIPHFAEGITNRRALHD